MGHGAFHIASELFVVLTYNYGEDGYPLTGVYGLDDLPLERLEVLTGEIDAAKLKSGGYILECVHLDDYGRPHMDSLRYGVGEKVLLHNSRMISPESDEREYTTHKYEVMAVVAIKLTNWTRYMISELSAVSSSIFGGFFDLNT